jgi:isocitrate lyase
VTGRQSTRCRPVSSQIAATMAQGRSLVPSAAVAVFIQPEITIADDEAGFGGGTGNYLLVQQCVEVVVTRMIFVFLTASIHSCGSLQWNTRYGRGA